MKRLRLVCLAIGVLARYQPLSFAQILPAQTVAGDAGGSNSAHPVITIAGLCHNSGDSSTANASCKTIITQAEFDKVVNAIQPGMSPHVRHEFALRYADALILAKKAESLGLDKGPEYEEQMKVARIQVLSQDLTKLLQETASHISEEDIESYFRQHLPKFEKANVDRLYVPKNRQPKAPTSGAAASDVGRAKYLKESEEAMRAEADRLHARAAAGEDFAKLQVDAYKAAGMTTSAPNTSLQIRRASLPRTQVSVMDLKPGEVSPVFTDPNGFFIYRMTAKESLSLDQTREEIRANLRIERMESEMRRIHESTTLTIDEGSFSR